MIANSNAANRQLEEQIAVSKGFESISDLWGQFSELMVQAGTPVPASAQSSDAPSDTPASRA